jgi:hypothetical protein
MSDDYVDPVTNGIGLVNVSADDPGALLVGRGRLHSNGPGAPASRDKQICAYARMTGWCEVRNPGCGAQLTRHTEEV